MTRLNEVEVAVLREFEGKWIEDSQHPFTTGKELNLSNKMTYSRNEINGAITRLAEIKYLFPMLKGMGMEAYLWEGKISNDGIDYLRNLDNPAEERKSSAQIIYNYGSMTSVVGNGNTVSINITDSFNALRDIVKSDDEANQIISEMENEAKDENPSLDAILKKGKKLWKKYGDVVIDEVIKIIGALIRSIMC